MKHLLPILLVLAMVGCREKQQPEPSYTYPSSAGEVRLFVDTSAELKLVQDRANRMAELTRHTDSMRNLLDSALYYYTKESCAPSDSVHYWYLKLAKITHYKPH